MTKLIATITLVTGEGEVPAGGHLEISDLFEAQSLVERGYARLLDTTAIPAVVLEPEPVIEPEPTLEPVIEPEPLPAEPTTDGEPSALNDVFELLEDEHFVKAGPRAGKPKVDIVSEMVGSTVSAAEIDAAWEAFNEE